MTALPLRRAFGVARQSRSGDDSHSPEEQEARMEAASGREGYELVEVALERDVSGGRPLEKRPGLLRAVEAIEAGEAEILVVAYFDRLVRSLEVQAQVLRRVEAANGKVLALDFGEVSNGTAAQWMSATAVGMASEFHRRVTREKSMEKKALLVADGIFVGPPPPGYDHGPDKRLVPNDDADTMAEAFELRDEGATLKEVWAFLAERGISRSYAQVGKLLASPVYIGDIKFGKLRKEQAHKGIVDRDVWNRVQRRRSVAGRNGKSDRLLARLGVLRCGTCGSRMTVTHRTPRPGGKSYPAYRCGGYTNGCPRPVSISATEIEEFVVQKVEDIQKDKRGRASAARAASQLHRDADQAQENLARAVRIAMAAGVADEDATVEELAELRRIRDEKRAKAEQLGPLPTTTVASTDDLTFDEWRDLIRVRLARVIVAPGRGTDRVRVERLGE